MRTPEHLFHLIGLVSPVNPAHVDVFSLNTTVIENRSTVMAMLFCNSLQEIYVNYKVYN